MDYLGEKKRGVKLPLQFNCPKCDSEIVTKFLSFGEELSCPYCGTPISVPESAQLTSEDASLLEIWKTERAFRETTQKITIADKLKRKYKKINVVAGILVFLVSIFLLENVISSWIFRYIVSSLVGGAVSYTISAFQKEEKDSKLKSELEKETE